MMDLLCAVGWCNVACRLLGEFSVDSIAQCVIQALAHQDIQKGYLVIPFQFHGKLDVGFLEIRWHGKSLRVDGLCGQTANASSTYLCQHFNFIRLELMAPLWKLS
jgi:hypothetical protein